MGILTNHTEDAVQGREIVSKEPARLGIGKRTTVTTRGWTPDPNGSAFERRMAAQMQQQASTRIIAKESHRHANANAGSAGVIAPTTRPKSDRVSVLVGKSFLYTDLTYTITRTEPGVVWARAGMFGRETRFSRTAVVNCLNRSSVDMGRPAKDDPMMGFKRNVSSTDIPKYYEDERGRVQTVPNPWKGR